MIEGTIDIFAFESELYKALDSSAHMAFTVEKMLQNIVRQVSQRPDFILSFTYSFIHLFIHSFIHKQRIKDDVSRVPTPPGKS